MNKQTKADLVVTVEKLLNLYFSNQDASKFLGSCYFYLIEKQMMMHPNDKFKSDGKKILRRQHVPSVVCFQRLCSGKNDENGRRGAIAKKKNMVVRVIL